MKKVKIYKCSGNFWYKCKLFPFITSVIEAEDLKVDESTRNDTFHQNYEISNFYYSNELYGYILKEDCTDIVNNVSTTFGPSSCITKDLLKVRKFDTGAVRDADNDKEDYIESISWVTLKRYCKYMKAQEVKYGRGNWKKGIPIEEYEKSLMRHLQKYLVNKYDGSNDEPDVDHLSAAMFNLQGLIHEIEKLYIK